MKTDLTHSDELLLQFNTARMFLAEEEEEEEEARIVVSLLDITERKRAEEAIHKLSYQNTLILDSLGEGVYGVDVSGKATFVNPAAAAMTGYTTEELLRQPMHEILHHSKPDGTPYPREECPIYAAFRDGLEHCITDEVFWRKDGTSFPVEYVSTPIQEQDKLIGAVVVFKDITERKRAEEALLKSEERFKQVAENAGEWIWEVDADGLYTYASPVVERILGFKPEEIVGKKHFYDLFSPDIREELKQAAFETFARKEAFRNFVNPNVNKNGDIVIWETSGTPVVDNKGNLLGYRGVDTDITEHKRAEEALCKSETLFRSVWDNSKDSMRLTDENGLMVMVNQAFCDFTGKSREELEGKSLADVYEQSDRERILKSYIENYSNNKLLPYLERKFKLWNGEEVWFAVTNAFLNSNGIHPLVLSVFRDITERKQAEEELKISHKTYLGIINSLTEAIYIQDENGVFLEVNKTAEKFYGHPKEYFIGKTPELISAPGKNDIPMIAEAVKKAFNGEPQSFEFWGLRENGTIFPKSVNLTSGEYFGKKVVIATARDITERKRAEEQIKRLNHIYIVLSNINQAIVRIHEREQLFIEACRIAVDDGKFRMAWLGMVNSQTQKVEAVASAGLINDYLDKIDIDLSSEKHSKGPTGRTIQSGTHFIVNDIENDDTMIPWKEDAKRLSFRSSASFPLKVFGKTNGCFNLYSSEVGFFDEDEIKLLDELATDISFALEFIEREVQRKQAEESLHQAEENYRGIFENAVEGIYQSTPEGLFLSVNPAMVRIFGYETQEHMVASISNIAQQFYVEPTTRLALIRALKETGVVLGLVYQAYRKDGSIIWVTENARGVRDTNGVLLFFEGFIEDITERKQAEEELKISHKTYLGIINSLTEAIYIQDENGVFLEVNKTAEKFYGHPKEYFIGKTPELISAPGKNDIPMIAEAVKKAFNGEPQSFEFWGLRENGTIFPKSVNLTSGEYFGKKVVIATARDITERKRAEEEIISQKNRFEQLFENSPIAIALLDDQDKVVVINESFSAMFGYFLEEIRGQSLEDLIVPPELKKEAKSYSDQTREGNQINKESYRKKKDGTLVYVQIVGVPVNINDKTVGIYGMYVDLTQRKEAEEKMKIAKELAEQSDKLKSAFLAQMSHEIRTPINVISGNVDYLNDSLGEKMDSEVRESFDNINLSSKRIIRTIDLILNVAEVKTSGYKPHLIKVDLNSEVLNRLFKEHQLSAKHKGLELIYKCELKETKILADEYSVNQIFANLVDNAIKYTKKGKVEILLGKNKTGNIMVEIKDTGIGMSKEFLPKLFKPFVQEDEGYTRSYEGNGLGLALVKRYCDINNAVIEVESEKNVGSTFRVTFSRE